MQKDIDRRYDSCEQLAEDLRRFQAGEPIAARPVSAIERGWKWARRRPAIAGMIGVSIVAAVALVAGGIVYNGKLVKERNVANAQRQQAVIAQEESEKQTLLAEEARIEADAQRGVATDRATEANKARSQAEEQRQKALEAEIKAKQLLAQAHVDKGASALHEGDTTKALGWFATAQSVDQGNETNNRLSAMRTWNTLNQTPKPIIELATRAVAQANTINGRRLAEWAILNRDTNQALVLYNQQSRFSKGLAAAHRSKSTLHETSAEKLRRSPLLEIPEFHPKHRVESRSQSDCSSIREVTVSSFPLHEERCLRHHRLRRKNCHSRIHTRQHDTGIVSIRPYGQIPSHTVAFYRQYAPLECNDWQTSFPGRLSSGHKSLQSQIHT